MNLEDIGELGLIKKFAESLAINDTRVVAGIGDDAAVIRTQKQDTLTLFTMDTLIEGIHFTLDTLTPYRIGWKALAVNLSDIAAMGGIPRYALVSLGLKAKTSTKFVDGLYRGIKTLGGKCRVSVIGGDTVKSPRQLTITIASG
ncbi:MAG: hypothetical protein GXO98_01305 [Nitrospirae bacterium]|nr:hypothetical protein [Nitrospirota bacterium]